jgi:hypothetical protein
MTYLAAAAGIAMYLVLLAQRIDRLTVYLVCAIAFNIAPYVICLILVRTVQRPLTALCASVLLLIVDMRLFRDIIVFKGFSIPRFVYSAVISMYAPLWKMALVLPAGCLVGLLIDRCLRKSSEQ